MTALSAQRSTLEALKGRAAYPIAASVKPYKGGLCMLVAGYAKPGATVTGAWCIGRSCNTYDNSSGSAGDITGEFEEGLFWWVNGDSIAQADVGKVCHITDDQTVAKGGLGTKSPAGIIRAVDSVKGVLVESSLALSKALTDLGYAEENRLQAGTVTLSAGVGTVATGITVTANSKVIVTMNTPAGTLGTWGYEVKDADLVVGAPGTGTIVVRSINEDKTAATSDTSTVNYLIIG